MNRIPAIAIFENWKNNKKIFPVDKKYKNLVEKSIQFEEIKDEDGDPCEDLQALTEWVKTSISELMNLEAFNVLAINFSTYGASFVHLDKEGKSIAPLYNYLKPFPEELKEKFYRKYGDEMDFALHTASPVLGNLN